MSRFLTKSLRPLYFKTFQTSYVWICFSLYDCLERGWTQSGAVWNSVRIWPSFTQWLWKKVFLKYALVFILNSTINFLLNLDSEFSRLTMLHDFETNLFFVQNLDFQNCSSFTHDEFLSKFPAESGRHSLFYVSRWLKFEI